MKLARSTKVLVRFNLCQFTKQSTELVNYLLSGTCDDGQTKALIAMTIDKMGVHLNLSRGKIIYCILPQSIIESDELGVSNIHKRTTNLMV